MAGKLLKFKAHGAFSKKKDARAKEKRVDGFIKEVKIKGHTRFLVLTRR